MLPHLRSSAVGDSLLKFRGYKRRVTRYAASGFLKARLEHRS